MDLKTSVTELPLVGSVYAQRLKRLDIENLQDLLLHIPSRYLDYRLISEISRIQVGEIVTIKGLVTSAKNIYTNKGKRIQVAEVKDATGAIQTIWFNQPFLVRNIKVNEHYSLSGKVDWFNRKKSLISPEYENIEEKGSTLHTGRLVPVYPETARLSSKWVRGKVAYVFQNVKQELVEFLPANILSKFSYPNLRKAIESIHFPNDLSEVNIARQRLAFNELLLIQLKRLFRKNDWSKIKASHKLTIDEKLFDQFKKTLPFKLTESQLKSINEIFQDLQKDYPMNRLLEGDVGSGKTLVAAAGAFFAFVNGFQSVFMAPTQILAQQHYTSLAKIFEKFKVRVSLITSEKIKRDLGKTDIFVGTHALIHKKVVFDNVAYIVIDEQHKFGVEQRTHLVQKVGKKRRAPHVLTMTATPIPRTVALTIYGDLDLSTLTELPTGRKPITTWLVPPQKRGGAYEWVREQINKEEVQAYIVCPLIEESQIETMKQIKAATAEYEKLKEIFPEFNVGLLHGRLRADEKNEVLAAFKRGKVHILVSTPVVEVGIDVANATIMIIEAAERFGLAQLHQLRGRVGRGEKKSYCLLFTESKSLKVTTRLEALRRTISGFELAELDLQLRGPGEVFGTKQHGFPDLKIASWSDTDLIKKARSVAQEAIDHPEKYPRLIKLIEFDSVVVN